MSTSSDGNGNGFDYDVFISYARKDNETASAAEGGWISMLHRALEVRLNQLLSEDSRVWRDPRLSGNDVLQAELISTVARTAVLVAILSPRYLGSSWCRDELSTFTEAANDNSSARGSKSRIFKVIKTPVELDQQPKPLRELLGYPFFSEDPEKKRAREFYPDWGPQAREEAAARIDDLAHEIRDLLTLLKPGGAAPRSAPRGKVYLALTTSDKTDQRDQLMRELKDRGYEVVPDRQLPQTDSEFASTVSEALQGAVLSLHLIGKPYGLVPEGSERSIAELQVELAARHSTANPEFGQFIWLPSDIAAGESRQQAFIDRLRNDIDLQDGDDLLETPFSEFQTELNSRLDAIEQGQRTASGAGAQPATAADDGLTRIYLLYEQRDREAIKPIRTHLFGLGYEIEKPVFDGDEADIAHAHSERLKCSDAVLLYWGAGSEAWLDSKRRDLKKARGDRAGRGFASTAVYIGDPQTDAKEDFETRELLTITAGGEFSPASLSDFLRPIALGSNADGGIGEPHD